MGFYRSKDDKVLLGICGGLADKFGINTGIIRIVAVLLITITFPVGPIIYFSLGLMPLESNKKSAKKDNETSTKESSNPDTGRSEVGDYNMVAKGKNGQVELHDNRIKITRKGFFSKLSHFGKGAKEIPLRNITSVQFKQAGLSVGYIQFGQSGYSESKGGIFDATDDENTVTFTKKNEEDFEKLKEKINSNSTAEVKTNSNNETAVEKLKKRYAEGKIDKDEYEEMLSTLKE